MDRPKAAPSAFRGSPAGAEELARKLVAESGVMLLPGSCYFSDLPRPHRLWPRYFPRALQALEDGSTEKII